MKVNIRKMNINFKISIVLQLPFSIFNIATGDLGNNLEQRLSLHRLMKEYICL